MHNVRNMFKYTSKMTSVMVNMIDIDHHKDGDHEIRYEPRFNLRHCRIKLSSAVTEQ